MEEDVHFLIDSAPPTEVEYALRCLDSDVAYSTQELRELIIGDWGYLPQRSFTFSTRRLFDLSMGE